MVVMQMMIEFAFCGAISLGYSFVLRIRSHWMKLWSRYLPPISRKTSLSSEPQVGLLMVPKFPASQESTRNWAMPSFFTSLVRAGLVHSVENVWIPWLQLVKGSTKNGRKFWFGGQWFPGFHPRGLPAFSTLYPEGFAHYWYPHCQSFVKVHNPFYRLHPASRTPYLLLRSLMSNPRFILHSTSCTYQLNVL